MTLPDPNYIKRGTVEWVRHPRSDQRPATDYDIGHVHFDSGGYTMLHRHHFLKLTDALRVEGDEAHDRAVRKAALEEAAEHLEQTAQDIRRNGYPGAERRPVYEIALAETLEVQAGIIRLLAERDEARQQVAALREALAVHSQGPIDDGSSYCTACGRRNGEHNEGCEVVEMLSDSERNLAENAPPQPQVSSITISRDDDDGIDTVSGSGLIHLEMMGDTWAHLEAGGYRLKLLCHRGQLLILNEEDEVDDEDDAADVRERWHRADGFESAICHAVSHLKGIGVDIPSMEVVLKKKKKEILSGTEGE